MDEVTEGAVSTTLVEALRAGGEALDRGARGPAPELRMLHDAGLLRAPLPVAEGGRGWGTTPAGGPAMVATLMALGGAGLPIARLYEGHVNALRLVGTHGTEAQRARVAESVRAGALLGVWGADGPSPVGLLAATGASPPGLCGTKAFASGLGDVALAIVTARAEGGLCMVLVDATDPARARFEPWDVDAMVGSRSGHFCCDGLPATAAERLGSADALFAEPDFHGGLWRLAACYAGAMARLAGLTAAAATARAPNPTGLLQARLGLLAIEAESAALWAHHAATLAEGAAPETVDAAGARRTVRTVLFAREAVEHAANRLLDGVERVTGTALHRRTSEAGRLARDLRFYLRQADLDGKLAMATQYWLGEAHA